MRAAAFTLALIGFVPTAWTRPALPPVRAEALRAHMRFLADDKLEGRGTGTRGHELAAAYVAAQLEASGLAPAGTEGSFLQPVPFRLGRTLPQGCAMAFGTGVDQQRLVYGDDFLVTPDFLRPSAEVDAELVFAGFGVTAPELTHDDYQGIDVRGKVAVILSGAPASFPHDQRAYYSHRTGKQETAAAHGAIGLVTLLTPTDERRRPWDKLRLDAVRPGARWLGSKGQPSDATPALKVVTTLSRPAADRLLSRAGKNPTELFAAAERGRVPGFALGTRLRARTATEHLQRSSPNVAARLPGRGPLASEVVVVSAHLDHLGIGAPVDGDTINNGAYDNASGTAILLELARVFAAAPQGPRRSILFLAVTGEEMGLQGSDHFARFPTVPAASIVANLNVDMVMMLGPLSHVVLYGAEHSTLGPTFTSAARQLGLTVVPNPAPDEVVFIRSDQFSFVRQGIPAIFPVAYGSGDARAKEAFIAWRRSRYHAPSDDMKQTFDWKAGVDFAGLCSQGLWQVANDAGRPAWNQPNFFGARFRRPR